MQSQTIYNILRRKIEHTIKAGKKKDSPLELFINDD